MGCVRPRAGQAVTDHETVENFIDLFHGRYDYYGAWSGGAVLNAYYSDVEGPYIPMKDHLKDGPFLGVYPVTDDNTTGWGCVDIDGKDHGGDWEAMWRLAATLQDVLYYKDVDAWLERTANGIHVWVFAEERLPAETMRHALLVACEVAEYKPKEVNPKQAHVSADKPLGNYVRLPYYGALVKGTPSDRFVIDEDGRPMDVATWSRTAMGCRTPLRVLAHMATMYAPPEVKNTSVLTDAATEEAFRLIEPLLPPVVSMIFRDGPLEDRSTAMVKTCVILRDEGWRAQSVFIVLKALDARLGKFVGRPDQDDRLLDIIQKVGL